MESRAFLNLLQDIGRRLDDNMSLDALSAHAEQSRLHLHREFRRLAGETPKQHTQRLRLTRAFHRQFGRTPMHYRRAAFSDVSDADRTRHVALTNSIAPCVHLFHLAVLDSPRRRPMPVISIAREERAAQPILYIRRRIARAELLNTLAECFGTLYGHACRAGRRRNPRRTL